jgi:hypothetical protein
MELLLSSKSLHAVAILASVERQSHHYFWLLTGVLFLKLKLKSFYSGRERTWCLNGTD